MLDLSVSEKDFILNLFGQTTVKANDPSAVEICQFVRSISVKIHDDNDLKEIQ